MRHAIRLQATPRRTARELERRRPLPGGREERFAGYGAVGVPFASGDVLAFRHFVASSIGPPYTSIWHRSPDDRWTVYANVEPARSCPRFFGAALDDVMVTGIRVRWTGPAQVSVSAPAARIEWGMRLGTTPATRLLSTAALLLPEPLWSSASLMDTLGGLAGRALGAGRLSLAGRTPNGKAFRLAPRQIWRVVASAAVVRGRELGSTTPLPGQARLADFWIPNTGLFAFGAAFFEPTDPSHPLTLISGRASS